MLSARQMLIFKYIVEEFIETAEPVGSKLLMTKYELPYSSATIRNEMSKLEELGFLVKTHTSSGRVPSKKGYYYYVNTLLQPNVDEQVKNQVATIFSDTHQSLNSLIKESCEMLSQLTDLTAVALGPNSSYECLQNITLVPIGTRNVTAIIVTDKGHVENRVFTLSETLSLDDLQSCVAVMNDTLVGTPINQVADRLENDVKPILNTRIKEHEILFNQPEYNDVNKLRKLVSAFENSSNWNFLAPTDDDGIKVLIGDDSNVSGLDDVSVISSSFDTGGASKGTISVIGPTRMPYKKVVSLVEYITENIERIIKENDE